MTKTLRQLNSLVQATTKLAVSVCSYDRLPLFVCTNCLLMVKNDFSDFDWQAATAAGRALYGTSFLLTVYNYLDSHNTDQSSIYVSLLHSLRNNWNEYRQLILQSIPYLFRSIKGLWFSRAVHWLTQIVLPM